MFFSNLSASWQETFADAGDGDGRGKPFRTILVQKSFSKFEIYIYFIYRFFGGGISKYILECVHIYRK